MRTPLPKLLALVLALVFIAGACSGDDSRPSLESGADAEASEELARSATTLPLNETLSCVAQSTIAGEHPVYDAPDAAEPSSTLTNPVASGAPLVFLAVEDDNRNCNALGEWIEVYLPVRPNGSTGYVKKDDVQLTQHDWRIEVDLANFNLQVFCRTSCPEAPSDEEQTFLDAPIAIAADNTPTPGGVYYTTELIAPPEPDSAYGTHAYGLSGFSEVLETFNGGPGQLGIHGTNQPELIGTKVSHGCIRMTNENIDTLAPVLPLGVPVEIFDAAAGQPEPGT